MRTCSLQRATTVFFVCSRRYAHLALRLTEPRLINATPPTVCFRSVCGGPGHDLGLLDGCVQSFPFPSPSGTTLMPPDFSLCASFLAPPAPLVALSVGFTLLCPQATASPVRTLKGHRKKAFNVVWSPLMANMLASGSDDRTVIVWNISTGDPTVRSFPGTTLVPFWFRFPFELPFDSSPPRVGSPCCLADVISFVCLFGCLFVLFVLLSQVLRGHTSNIRALAWSHEVPFWILSGSWDGTIRLWDTRSAECLKVGRGPFVSLSLI